LTVDGQVRLTACHELLDAYPQSLRMREQVEALEGALPDQPGVAVSFCKTIIESTCKTILTDRRVTVDTKWEAPQLVRECLKNLNLGQNDDGTKDPRLQTGAANVIRGLNSLIQGIVEIRNIHGSGAHGADAFAPVLTSHYAEMLARATDAVVGVLYRVHSQSIRQDPQARFTYGQHGDFDEFIDLEHGPFIVLDVPLIASEALYRTDFAAYQAALVEFRQERGAAEDASG
jgi:hypothetical protein